MFRPQASGQVFLQIVCNEPCAGGLKQTLFAAGRRLALVLHRRPGIISLIPLTLLATTGALLIVRPYLAPALNQATGPMPLEVVPKSKPDPSLTPPTLDQISDKAHCAYPDAQITRIYLPQDPDDTFAVRLRLPEDKNPHGNTAMRFDRDSGSVLQAHGSRMTSAVQKVLWYAPYPWHTGDAMGILGRNLVSLSGLTSAWLMVTGLIWWARRWPSRKGRTLDIP